MDHREDLDARRIADPEGGTWRTTTGSSSSLGGGHQEGHQGGNRDPPRSQGGQGQRQNQQDREACKHSPGRRIRCRGGCAQARSVLGCENMGKRTRSQRKGSSPKNRVSATGSRSQQASKGQREIAEVVDLVHSPAHTAPLAKVKFEDGQIATWQPQRE